MTHRYATYKRPTSELKTTQTESEGMEKKYSKQLHREKKSQGSNTYIRENRLQNKAHEKRHRWTLHNT